MTSNREVVERTIAIVNDLLGRERVVPCEDHPPADFEWGVVGCIDCVLWVTEQGVMGDLEAIRDALMLDEQSPPAEPGKQSWFRQEYERSKRHNEQLGPYGGMVVTGTGFDRPAPDDRGL